MSREKKSAKHEKPRAKKEKAVLDAEKVKKPNIFSKIKAGFLKMSMTSRVLVITLISICLAVLVAIGAVISVYFDFKQEYNDRYTEITDQEIVDIKPIDDKIINIALFGIDSRSENYSGNSDSIMILSVNTGTGDIKLVSVMRDSLVNMVKQSNGKTPNPNKINSAYARGGAIYAIKVLNENFGLDIQKAITVNFFGMAEIIDAVGGIEINVLKREINVKNGLNSNIKEQAKKAGVEPTLVTEPGLQKLNGMQAVAWARIRSVSSEQGTANDYGRTDRQRIVMEKLLEKVLAMDMNWSEFYNFAKKLLAYMKIEGVGFDFDTAASIAFKVLSKKGRFEQTRIPQTKYVIDDDFRPKYAGSCVYYDLGYASKMLHALIYEGISNEDYMKTNGVEKNKWYTGAMASSSNKGDKDEDDEPEADEPSVDNPETDEPTTDEPTTDNPTTDTPTTDTPSTGDGDTTDTPTDTPPSGEGSGNDHGGTENNDPPATEQPPTE